MDKDKLKHFNDIYNTYYRKCYLFAKSYVQNNELAEDFASEAMVKLWENIDNIHEVQNIKAFLFTITRNLSLNYLRHRQIKMQVHEHLFKNEQKNIDLRIATLEALDPEVLFAEEIDLIIQQTLTSLTPQTRKVFELSRYQEKSGKEIAKELGISVKGVDYHIARAINSLRIALRDYLPIILL